jgi:hypothetical protein
VGQDAPAILRFVTELADPANSELLYLFLTQSKEAMDRYGLTEGEQGILLSGDLSVIQAALDSAALSAGIGEFESAIGIVVSYSAPPRPATQSFVGTW